jgi:2-phosphosulfolactate phosphatase
VVPLGPHEAKSHRRPNGAIAPPTRSPGPRLERWPGAAAGIRPCLEDLLGAGAVLSGLPQCECSPEALAAVGAYQRFESNLPGALMDCVGGRELTAWGYPEDVRLAASLDADPTVPVLADEGCFAAEG